MNRFENRLTDLSKQFASAEARAKVHMEENKRIAEELALLKADLKKANEFRLQAEQLKQELQLLQAQIKGTGGGSGGDALKEVQGERNRLIEELAKLRPRAEKAETGLAGAVASIQRLEADLQQHKFMLGESQGKADRFRGENEGLKAEVTGLRMQLEDATARSEHAIATLREERDLLHSELTRLREALQAASANMSEGMQAVAKLSNIDARTVSSQVRHMHDHVVAFV